MKRKLNEKLNGLEDQSPRFDWMKSLASDGVGHFSNYGDQ
jgi:hypothetical protein